MKATLAAQPSALRSVLSYSVDGLSGREELLLKSFVRMLNHYTEQIWNYSPHSTDLLVQAKDSPSSSAVPPAVQRVLTVSASGEEGEFCITLPLHASQLEKQLNRLGALLLQAKTQASAPEQPASQVLVLRRWPQLALLRAPGRMQLATLLTGQPLTLTALQQRSGQPLNSCIAFLAELKLANLLEPANADLPALVQPDYSPLPDQTPPQTHSVLPVVTQTAGAASMPPRKALSAAVQPGLLARIRNRLGLPVAQQSLVNEQ